MVAKPARMKLMALPLMCLSVLVTVSCADNHRPALVESHLRRMTIIIGQTAMDRDRLDRAPNLRAILNVKANWEPNIDYEECHARGIHVLSAAPAMAPAVAEYCVAQAIISLPVLVYGDALLRT